MRQIAGPWISTGAHNHDGEDREEAVHASIGVKGVAQLAPEIGLHHLLHLRARSYMGVQRSNTLMQCFNHKLAWCLWSARLPTVLASRSSSRTPQDRLLVQGWQGAVDRAGAKGAPWT
jgi:hypothetical protein